MESPMHSGSCRCCASEGAYKDVKSSYHWMGEEEIYADMLKDCFDIILSPATDGQEEGGICEICITQLRNAANFKKQVLHTDEQFRNKLQSSYFKPEIVKVEVPGEDGIDSDDNNASAEDGYSGPEFDVPIKSESPEEPKTKKRSAKKAPTTRAKKSKTDDAESSTKRIQQQANSSAVRILSGLKELKVTLRRPNNIREGSHYGNSSERATEDVSKHRFNIRQILLKSNATPIRRYEVMRYFCCFCSAQYTDPAALKTHTLTDHDDATKETFMQSVGIAAFLVKLDITCLKCNICSHNMDSLQQLIDHLIKEHGETYHTDINNHILPFKFEDGEIFKCALCQSVLNTFKTLHEHTCTHYKNYRCSECSAGFVNRHAMKVHNDCHNIGRYKCAFCTKVFDTVRKKKSHESSVHIQFLNKCGFCNEKFKAYDHKLKHMASVHNVPVPKIECQACGKTFRRQALLTSHIHHDHLMEKRFKCNTCDMRFVSKYSLDEHTVKHIGVKSFICEICSKAYMRKKSLREHVRIHTNDKRFKCEICDRAFVQKCALSGHLRSKHGDIL